MLFYISHLVFDTGKADVVQLLLDHGADITKTNSIGKTAVQLSSFVGMEIYLKKSLSEVSYNKHAADAGVARIFDCVGPKVEKIMEF